MDEKQQRTENLEARFEEAAIKIGDLLIGSLEALAAGHGSAAVPRDAMTRRASIGS